MTEAQVTLEDIVNNLKHVASDLGPVPKTRKGKEPSDPMLASLSSLRKCVEDLATFVQNQQIKQDSKENTLREHEDEIDHLKQKNLKCKIIITSKSQFGDCLIKTDAQLQHENKSLVNHVVDLVKLKYNQEITPR